MTNKDTSPVLWAIVDARGCIVKSSGGSSTARRLMVYSTHHHAQDALNNGWTQQYYRGQDLYVKQVYKAVEPSNE